MIINFAENGQTKYGLKEYIVDTPEDLDNLPKDDPMGSYAFIISTSEVRMKNGLGK